MVPRLSPMNTLCNMHACRQGTKAGVGSGVENKASGVVYTAKILCYFNIIRNYNIVPL